MKVIYSYEITCLKIILHIEYMKKLPFHIRRQLKKNYKSRLIENPYNWAPPIKILNIESKFKNINETQHQFKYKDSRFYYHKKNDSKYLLILFHGSVGNNSLPVYRGAYYNIKEVDILSISDNLVNKFSNKRLDLSWYLSTNNMDNETMYIDIIDNVIKSKSYKKVLFAGTSGGGYPALKFSSYFNKYAIIGNSQIYLDKHIYWNELIKKIKYHGSLINYDNINDIIKKNGPPKKIYLFQNKLDTHHYDKHFLPFKDFMKKNYSDNLVDIVFYGCKLAKNQHKYFMPVNL